MENNILLPPSKGEQNNIPLPPSKGELSRRSINIGMNKIHIFRNSTIERFFANFDATFSGYNDISLIPEEADVYFWVYLSPVKTDAGIFASEIEAYVQQIQFVLSQLKPYKTCYAFTMYNMHFIYHENSNDVINRAIADYNNQLYSLSKTYTNLKVIEFSRFCRHYPSSSLIDWKYYYISKMQINPRLAVDFDRWLQAEIAAIEGKRKKCLALDLDNTLWGGILGEDGIEGIQIGNTYPGSAFLDFQNNLLELSKNGVILTVCSKNNEQDVIEAWHKNPFLQIRSEHLAAWRINWENKAENLASLAQELNIGLDSIVLIDDNPSERALVRQMYPMVETPEFPKQPYLLPEFFEKLCNDYFQIYKLTGEDKSKPEQYKANAQRATFQKSFTSFDDYLKSLEIELTINELNPVNLPRIAQLTQKTNQFNLTTKRYSEEDIKAFADQGAKIYCLQVKDKFGDNGITGAAIVTAGNHTGIAEIDSFLLSCRILGKQIENVFLKYVLLQLKNLGYRQINATFVPTSKNNQANDFYDMNGFKWVGTDGNGVKNYCLPVEDFNLTIPEILKINLK